MMQRSTRFRPWLPPQAVLAVALTGAGSVLSVLPGMAATVDGFVASCTGNNDGTGQCVNLETTQRFSCLIIPGQVIDCKSRAGRSFQCVWISGVQANQADFWCDPQVDALLRDEISANQLPEQFQPVITPPTGDPLGSNQRDRVNLDSLTSPIQPVLLDPVKQTPLP